MKACLYSMVAVSAAYLFTGTAVALPPINKVIKQDPSIKSAADENAVRNGMRVALTLKDNKRVVGRVVWADPAGDYLMVRERAGAAPRKIKDKDIKNIDRIQPVAGGPKDEPEIFRITEVNGNVTTVKYYAPALSPGERSQLTEMEAAENQAARTRFLMGQILDSVGDQAQTLRAQLRLAAGQSELMNIYATEQAWLSSFSPYYPTARLGGAPWGLMISQAYAGTGGIMGGQSSAVGSASGMDTLITKGLALEKSLRETERTLSVARSRGLYENGELIAVMPAAQEKGVMPAADQGK